MIRLTGLVASSVFAAIAGYFLAYQQTGPVVAFAILAFATLAIAATRQKRAPLPVQLEIPADTNPVEPAIALGSLESAAILVDRNHAILSANSSAVDAFGSLAIGEDIRVAIRHPAVIECVAYAMSRDQASVREVENLGRRSTIFSLRAAPSGEGRILLTFTDVSPARLAERMRADFVANASHELRTPLATLVGFIETLQGTAANDEAARGRFLKVMADEAARMTRLIDDLLSLSRIELDKNIRPRDLISLPAIIGSLASTSAMALEADNRVLELHVAKELPRVVADADQVLQVLHNLLSNAIKYGRSGTPIAISAEQGSTIQGDVVKLTISDRGDGIPPEHIPRLTERFYRVDTGRSRRLGGTGLGLSIVKHIVERHRGVLEISSELGVGTSISFTLPAAVSQN